ncbi:hypothetical protein [Solimonas sp. SE-A11]|uniref:hypothetical protein n=1 Tax=Solimonas sp. SE-A11 TaxID=3054954 RepID=UPI00259CC759|nr:hypothetical protein [Solimonas sp. SE-A11]MDM4770676.1 hypothetical protein [Solimonas sp. SE-A11]
MLLQLSRLSTIVRAAMRTQTHIAISLQPPCRVAACVRLASFGKSKKQPLA